MQVAETLVVEEPRTSLSVEIACLIYSPGLCIVVSSSSGGRLKIIRKNLSAESASTAKRGDGQNGNKFVLRETEREAVLNAKEDNEFLDATGASLPPSRKLGIAMKDVRHLVFFLVQIYTVTNNRNALCDALIVMDGDEIIISRIIF